MSKNPSCGHGWWVKHTQEPHGAAACCKEGPSHGQCCLMYVSKANLCVLYMAFLKVEGREGESRFFESQ